MPHLPLLTAKIWQKSLILQVECMATALLPHQCKVENATEIVGVAKSQMHTKQGIIYLQPLVDIP